MNFDDELASATKSMVRHGLRIALLSAVVGAGVFYWSIKQPRLWTTSFAIAPEDELTNGSNMLAMQLGLSAPSSQGPDFYAEYLRSNEAFYEIVRRKFALQPPSKDSVALTDLLKIESTDSALKYNRAVREMLKHSTADVAKRSGLVKVTVSLTDPYVSKQVADQLVQAVTSLNNRVRQTRGRSEREFSESRLRLAKAELAAAEDSALAFTERNRNAEAPNLAMEKMRRARLIEQKQALLTTVELAYETARAEEVRNTPRVSLIIPPRMAVTGDPRGTVRRTFVAGVFTFGIFVVLYWLADRFGGGSVFGMLWRGIQVLFRGGEFTAKR